VQNSCCISSKIRNRRIDLRQRNLHNFSVSENAIGKACGAAAGDRRATSYNRSISVKK
jgi:hypothetical protein